jgi:DNA helicase-2/ATP-dependent DNA helicase PcrA
MIFNQTEKQEKEYLQQVITTIHDTINTTSTSVKEHIDTLQEYKDYGRTKISIPTKSVPCAKAY